MCYKSIIYAVAGRGMTILKTNSKACHKEQTMHTQKNHSQIRYIVELSKNKKNYDQPIKQFIKG